LGRICTNRILVEFLADDDDDGEEDNDEADRAEDRLVLTFWKEDNYPLLPAIDSNTPLEQLKRLLRVYAGEVRSK
jgi:hypothetical protein